MGTDPGEEVGEVIVPQANIVQVQTTLAIVMLWLDNVTKMCIVDTIVWATLTIVM